MKIEIDKWYVWCKRQVQVKRPCLDKYGKENSWWRVCDKDGNCFEVSDATLFPLDWTGYPPHRNCPLIK